MTAQPKPNAADVLRAAAQQAGWDLAEFDHWLAEHDAQVAAQALRGFAARMQPLVVSGSHVNLGAIVAESVEAQIERLATAGEPT